VTAALETHKLNKMFGAVTVAQSIDFSLKAGDRHALIGPNGAGKTSFVNLLTGALRPSDGHILMDGHDVTQESQSTRVKRGLGRTFQINALFRNLSVLDNVALGIAERLGVAGFWRPAAQYRKLKEEAIHLLDSLGIADEYRNPVGNLAYGKQRLVEIAIALGLKPKVLLLDEPAAGVPLAESERVFQVLDVLPADIAILLIEHDMDLVFRFARRITVLVQGAVLAEGSPQEIATDPRVRQVYLGEHEHA